MRAYGVKQKPPACARVCVCIYLYACAAYGVRARAYMRAPIMNMYRSFCGRYARVLFARAACVCV